MPFAAQPQADFWVPTGEIRAIAQQNGQLLLGGKFAGVRPSEGEGLALDLDSLQGHFEFPQVDGVVSAVVGDEVGGFYLGGDFRRVGGVPRFNLAHVTASREVDSWAPSPDGSVRALAFARGVVYVGGQFASIDNLGRSGLAAVDGRTGQLTSWNPGPNGPVDRLLVDHPTLFVAGTFTTIGNVSRAGLAAVDYEGAGAILPWNPHPYGRVTALAMSGDSLFVGGTFTNIGGATRDKVAALDVHTGFAAPWQPGGTNALASVEALALEGHAVYAGGQPLTNGGLVRPAAVAWDIESGAALPWTVVATGESPAINGLAVDGHRVIVAGSFAKIGPTPCRNVAILSADTGEVVGCWTETEGNVRALGVSRRSLYLAGARISWTTLPRQNLAAFQLDTGQPGDWKPVVQGDVLAIVPAGDTVFVGGNFVCPGGNGFVTNLAAISRSTGVVNDQWRPDPNGTVRTMTLAPNGVLFVGGDFNSVSGQWRPGVAALTPLGSITSWSSGTTGRVHTLLATANALYVGGEFFEIGGVFRKNLARLALTDGAVLPWSPDPDGAVYALQATSTNLIVGGSFEFVGGNHRAGLAALDASGQSTSWQPDVEGSVRCIVPAGDTLFVGGDFARGGQLRRANLAALSLASGSVLDWNPGLDGPAAALSLTTNRLVVAGAFQRSADHLQPGLAAYPLEGTPQLILPPVGRRSPIGGTATFQVLAIGAGPLTYQWRTSNTNIPGATEAVFTRTDVQPLQSGPYTVVVSNAVGSIVSPPAMLTVTVPPEILTHPGSQVTPPGETVTLTVNAWGVPAPSYTWRLNDEPIANATGSTLVLSNAEPAHAGRYSVLVYSEAGSVLSENAIVQVINPVHPFADAFPLASLLPGSAAGSRAGNNANATREEPFEPFHAGLPGGHSVWCTWIAPQSGRATFDTRGSSFDTLLAVYSGPTLSNLTWVAADDDRGEFGCSRVSFVATANMEYRIVVDGAAGASGSFNLNWSLQPNSPVEPQIVTEPITHSTVPGGPATFSVAAAAAPGLGPVAIQWFHNGRRIPGATDPTFTLASAAERDLGSYQASVRDITGATTFTRPAELIHSDVLAFVPRIKFKDGVGESVRLSALVREPAANRNVLSPGFSPSEVTVSTASTGVTAIVTSVQAARPLSSGSLCGATATPLLLFLTNDLPEEAAVIVEPLAGSISHILFAYEGPATAQFRTFLSCKESTATDNRILFRARPSLTYTVLSGGLGSSGLLIDRISVCRRAAVDARQAARQFPASWGNGRLHLQVPAGAAACDWSYQWRTNGVDVPLANSPALDIAGPWPITYSLVTSNCLGAVTNVIAEFIRLSIVAGNHTYFLSNATPTTNWFVIESTNRWPGPTDPWPPFFTNQSVSPLPTPLSFPPLEPSSGFFRVRRSP